MGRRARQKQTEIPDETQTGRQQQRIDGEMSEAKRLREEQRINRGVGGGKLREKVQI